jgi:hypothetical protein
MFPKLYPLVEFEEQELIVARERLVTLRDTNEGNMANRR